MATSDSSVSGNEFHAGTTNGEEMFGGIRFFFDPLPKLGNDIVHRACFWQEGEAPHFLKQASLAHDRVLARDEISEKFILQRSKLDFSPRRLHAQRGLITYPMRG